jgi:hypothetical protein
MFLSPHWNGNLLSAPTFCIHLFSKLNKSCPFDSYILQWYSLLTMQAGFDSKLRCFPLGKLNIFLAVETEWYFSKSDFQHQVILMMKIAAMARPYAEIPFHWCIAPCNPQLEQTFWVSGICKACTCAQVLAYRSQFIYINVYRWLAYRSQFICINVGINVDRSVNLSNRLYQN